MNDTDKSKNAVTEKECIFLESKSDEGFSDVAFADVEGKESSNKFKILAYSGNIMKHFFWGNCAFDLSGIKFAKRRVVVLEGHDRSRRVGFTTKQTIKDNITVEGEFLPNSVAQEMKGDLQAGCPMEASLMVIPLIVEEVKDGATVEVNGKRLKGPGHVFRKGIIKEVSMCSFGVDDNTKSLAANVKASVKVNFESYVGDISMDEKEKQQIIDEAYADGEKAERDVFAELKVACGDDAELLVQCLEEGKTKEEALQMRMDKMEEANKALKAELETAKAEKPEVKPEVKAEVKKGEIVTPAQAEFSDKASEQETEKTDPLFAWRSKYPNSEVPVDKFRTEESYLAFCKADGKGLISLKDRPVKEEK